MALRWRGWVGVVACFLPHIASAAPTVPDAAASPTSTSTSTPTATATATATTATATDTPPTATDSPSAPATPIPPPVEPGHFEFGSYGRVRIASDGRGGTGRQANIIAHGSRIDEESYAELELRREDTFADGIKNKVVATLALFPPFFHFSGNAAQSIVLRNLYAQATYDAYTVWVGSRMYRGDDIYLLDWWPLDNQNTVGGGVGAKLPTALGETTIAAHVGMQRLDNPYQYEQIPSTTPFGFGATQVTHLDRPRIVETLKLTHLIRREGGDAPAPSGHYGEGAKAGFKVVVYGEAHQLSAGVSRDPNTNLDRPLSSDSGFLFGSEVAYWTGKRDTFVQLFFRHARGVAAYDPLAAPASFANDKTTSGSTETLLALGGNYEAGPIGVLVGGYLRFFRDGSASPTTTQKYDEGTLVVRPQLYIGEHWGVAIEGSWQARRLALLDGSGDGPLSASLLRAGIIPYFSPAGRGSYKRPQFRLLYAVTQRNEAARSLYPQDDVFAQRRIEHFIGLGVEWWFNSSSYP